MLLLSGMLIIASTSTICLATDLTCNFCGKSITGRYVQSEGHNYHPSCYQEHVVPRCAICGKPVEGKYTVHDNRPYHNSCWERDIALRCATCGHIIEGEHLVDFWGNHYHDWHQEEYTSCSFCGRLICDNITYGGKQFDNKHHSCNLCLKNTITDPHEGAMLMQEACERLNKAGIEIDCDDAGLRMVSAGELASLSHSGAVDNFGLAQYEYETMLGIVISHKFTIYIRNNLPRSHFLSTAAHKWMHVWMYLNGKNDVDPPLLEGSCNYASHLVMEQIGDIKSDYIIHAMEISKDPEYGDGYRRVVALVEEKGIDSWLEYLRNHRFLPAGY